MQKFIINKLKYVFVRVYGIPIIVGYLMPNLFLYNKQFYFKLFSPTQLHSLIVKEHFYFKQLTIVKNYTIKPNCLNQNSLFTHN